MNNEMSFSIRKDSKRNYSFSALVILLFFMFAAVARSEAQSPRIFVCNEGTIPIYYASLRINRPFLSMYWMLEGWYEVKPDRGFFARCGVIEAEGTTHLVFGISNSDKEFGVVKYEFDNSCLDCNFKEEQICVKNDVMDYTSSSVTYLPPCPDGFKAVPTSQSVYAQGNATLTLTVRPSPNDYNRIAVYLSERKKPIATPPATSANDRENKPIVRENPVGKKNKRRGRPVNLTGNWEGIYYCAQGVTNLKLVISHRNPSGISAVFYFYASKNNPSVPSGSFRMTGTYDNKTKIITLKATRWINRPSGYSTVDLVGSISQGNIEISGKVINGACSTFSIKKK